jgi:hypothetical protein
VTFLAETQAVAVAHATASPLRPDEAVAVYDLGGGRFDAAVVRRCDDGLPGVGFGLLGRPEGLERVGGLDFDDLVWEHVRSGLGDDVSPDARIRRACTRAKEALSTDAEVVVRVRRGDVRGVVPLDRETFEGMVGPHVDATVAALRRTIESAGTEPERLAAVLLVGGCSRIPLVARTLAEELGRPVAVHADPTHLVARGAALAMPLASPAVGGPVLGSTASGYLVVPPRPVAPEPVAAEGTTEPEPSGSADLDYPEAADPAAASDPGAVSDPGGADEPGDIESPTVVIPAAATAAHTDPPTAPYRTPRVPPLRPAASATPGAHGGAAGGEGVASSVPAPSTASAATPLPAARLATSRAAAVLGGSARCRRSLPRMLVGAGALVVAALVLIALFRPDGPLDPPLDTGGAGDGTARATGAPTVPLPAGPADRAVPTAPVPTASVPGAEAGRAVGAGGDLSGGAASVRPRVPAPPSPARIAVDVPIDASEVAEPSVVTTPSAAASPRPARSGPGAGAPVIAEPRTPPAPAAPVA